MKKNELVSLIEQIVKREIKTVLEKNLKTTMKESVYLYAPRVVKEIIDETLEESLDELRKQSGRGSLKESTTMRFDTDSLSSLAHSHNNRNPKTINNRKFTNIITEIPAGPDSMITRRVNPDEIPEYLLKAFNKDYRETLKVAEDFRGIGASSFVPPSPADFNKTLD